MISDALVRKLNEQVTMEFAASQTYLAMACVLDSMGLKQLHERFVEQAQEERTHALKIITHLCEADARVEFEAIPKPQARYDSLTAIVQAALQNELKVTESIHQLVTQATAEKCYPTLEFLQWFVKEQVEEVAQMRDLLRAVELAGDNVLQVDAWASQMMGDDD